MIDRKDKKIEELLKDQRRRVSETLNRSTQSSEDLPPSKEEIKAAARKKFIHDLGEDRIIQYEKGDTFSNTG